MLSAIFCPFIGALNMPIQRKIGAANGSTLSKQNYPVFTVSGKQKKVNLRAGLKAEVRNELYKKCSPGTPKLIDNDKIL